MQVVGLPFQDELVLRVMKMLSPGSAPATGFPPTAPLRPPEAGSRPLDPPLRGAASGGNDDARTHGRGWP